MTHHFSFICSELDTSDVSLPVADKKTEEKLAFLGQDNIQNNKEEGER